MGLVRNPASPDISASIAKGVTHVCPDASDG
jgi:hypothetical protein